MSFEERKLTNDDFRKLFMTPRHPGDSSSSGSFAQPAPPTPSFATPSGGREPGTVRKHHDKAKEEKRRQKKHFYAKIKKEEDDQMAELARKYRDRAKERRDGGNPEQQSDDIMSSQGAYRAVAPDFRGNVDAAERRKQMIQESKFLGGDMEHTHLVKGLDYALLQKVRSELEAIGEDRDIDEIIEKEEEKEVPVPEPNAEFRSRLSRNIFRVVFKSAAPERNELFAPNRMAYVMDLEDEYAESDIPTTLIRSKADVPNAQGQATLTTNDIVINKLAQILSYLRQGSKASKKHRKKENKGKVEEPLKAPSKKTVEEDSIYGEIGDYVPTVSKSKSRGHDSKESRSSSRKDKDKSKSYFEKPAEDEVVLDKRGDKKREKDPWNEGEGKGDQTFGSILKRDEKSLSRAQKLLSKINAQPEGYAECYPGFDEMHDAIEDSDDEIDYSKMDPGKKKGTVGRWDFDSMEEYSDYMSNKEALPKAAFQFGVKMNDGRKTRKGGKEKNEKAQLDRQWQQIQAIMQKRKGGGGGGEGEPEPKTPKV